MSDYDKYIKAEKIDGLSHTLAAAILGLIAADETLSIEDGIDVTKRAVDICVSVLSKLDGKVN